MKRSALLAAAVAAVLVIGASPVSAAPCDVFTDVQDTDFFCSDVQWMKNRGVTLGCTTTTYCPNDFVTRAQMALFMRRLGRVMTPSLLGLQEQIAGGSLLPGQTQTMCTIDGPPAAAYVRTAMARGTYGGPVSGNSASLFLVASLNGGSFVNMSTFFLNVPAPSGHQVLTWHSSPFTIPANATSQFAIALGNSAGTGPSLTFGPGQCSIQVEVVNANPTTPPFDAP